MTTLTPSQLLQTLTKKNCTLVAVSKTRSVSEIEELFQLGVTHFGENRVEEAKGKIPFVAQEIRQAVTWHMIGHVQSRKVSQVVELFDWIDSVNSVEIAEKLSNATNDQKKTLKILLQVNISGEATKSGFEVSEWESNQEQLKVFLSQVKKILDLPHLKVEGLMTIAPATANPEEVRPVFRRTRQLLERLKKEFPQNNWSELSMGMSDDWEVALAEGATMARIGRALFK